ncbi:MAG: hypothetical protein BWY91_01233 [bacterium ADurb.BinA028]|nr:MAG: hypothetical protein BWY91_01233 [bacterium ADurb.BinA028]
MVKGTTMPTLRGSAGGSHFGSAPAMTRKPRYATEFHAVDRSSGSKVDCGALSGAFIGTTKTRP